MTISGGGSPPVSPDSIGSATPWLDSAFFTLTVPANGDNVGIPVLRLSVAVPGLVSTDGQSVIQVNTPGVYAVDVNAQSFTQHEVGVIFRVLPGDNADYHDTFFFGASVTAPDTTTSIVLSTSGYFVFDDTHKSLEVGLNSNGATLAASFSGWIKVRYVGPVPLWD